MTRDESSLSPHFRGNKCRSSKAMTYTGSSLFEIAYATWQLYERRLEERLVAPNLDLDA